MTRGNDQKLFRDEDGEVKSMFSEFEGITYRDSPMDCFILLARYKFAARFIKKHHRVIDAGCGKGAGSVFLSKFGESVVGADHDQDLVDANAAEYRSISNLSFEHLNLLDVIEHFQFEETEQVANNYASLLKPGGFAVIGTPNIASQPYASQRRRDSHPFEFRHDQFEDVLNSVFSNVFMFSMTDEIVSTQFQNYRGI